MPEVYRIPIIRVWDLLLVPLQGELEDALAERLLADVLEAIHAEEVSGLVIDITGLWMMDSHLCAVLSRLACAAELMGARTVVSGMSAETALTLQTMGLELAGVQTVLSLEQALELRGVTRDPARDALE